MKYYIVKIDFNMFLKKTKEILFYYIVCSIYDKIRYDKILIV
jgi:hypothetical protein